MAARWFVTAFSAVAATVSAHSLEPHRLSHLRVRGGLSAASSSGASVSVSQTSGLPGPASWVDVTFKCSSPCTPAKTDIIGLWGAADNVSATAPIEYFTAADADPDYTRKGTGKVAARLINMRTDLVFAFIRGGLEGTVAAVSPTISFANANQPRAPRLIPRQDPTELTLVWSSAMASGNPQVLLQPAIGGQVVTVPATTSTYTAADMCGGAATGQGYRAVGVLNTAVLTGLIPGAAYSYVFGDDSETAGPVNFTHVPAGPVYPFGIAAVGDMGQLTLDGSQEYYVFPPAPNTSRLIADDITAGRVQAMHHFGDISYARGYASEWDVFLDLITPISSRVPYATDLGNHERDWNNTWIPGTDSGGECGIPATRLFPQAQPSPDEPWYWLKQGPLFILHLSTEYDFTTGSAQWTYVKQALASVNRSETPFVLAFFHRPMYIDSTNFSPVNGDQTVAQLLRQHVEPLFMSAPAAGQHVDLVLQGHHHSYQRHCAVFNTTCLTKSSGPSNTFLHPAAPVQFVVGTGGAGFSTNIMPSPPPYTEYTAFQHGYARITVLNATALHLEFVNDADGSVADEAWILK